MTLRILFFGRYDPVYSRNAVLMKGLRLNGGIVTECRVQPSAHCWPLRLMWQYLRMRPEFDLMLVAFPGQEIMLLARMLTRKPIIFDAFTSHYEGYVEDRKFARPGSWRARWYWFLDWFSCRLATGVLTDTRAHADYFHSRFGVPRGNIHPVLLGTTLMPSNVSSRFDDVFAVHFHGSNIPLQGIDIIWGAVRRLWKENIRFNMIGPFTVPNELREHVLHDENVSFDELPSRMATADVCLGIFGASPKTQRVIPNKVYEALAMGKAVITADTPAIRELLDSGSAALICIADADALAHAILLLKSDVAMRERLAKSGHARLLERATPDIVGKQLKNLCEQISLRT